MFSFNFFDLFFGGRTISGSDRGELIFGSFGNDDIAGNGGDDLILGLFGNDKVSGGLGNDKIFGGFGRDTVEGGEGEDDLFGDAGNDRVVGNKGNDRMYGGRGRDLLVWNNGDGSDLMDGGLGHDRVQVNFNTDLVNEDLQNKDVAEFSVTDQGVQFARIELNDQTEAGLFQLDIRNTETLETNFGGGEDTAVITGTVLDEIDLDLDGGESVDTLKLSQAATGITVDLAAGTLGGSTAVNFENVIGTEFDDVISGDAQNNVISGLGGVDQIFGGGGNDSLIANKGNDFVFGGYGDDALVWNNGDGSDLLDGGEGNDLVQVNFNTDLVNDDLQNKDVAEFSVTDQGVQFARIELNDQTEAGLFQLDIRNTETLETNFGGGDDAAVIVGSVLDKIVLDLNGGDGIDLLDLSQAADGLNVNLAAGTINNFDIVVASSNIGEGVQKSDGENIIQSDSGSVPIATTNPTTPVDLDDIGLLELPLTDSTVLNFENVTGTVFNDTIRGDDQNNIIRGGAGNDVMTGGGGADTFVFFEEDAGVDFILDFDLAEDRLLFATTDPTITAESLLGQLSQQGDDVELNVNGKQITFEDADVNGFDASTFLFA